MLSHKLVAIGGISISNAETLIAEGADGIAMISDISKSENPDARAREWVELFENFPG
ncbi:MAG: thiamine phosphate synthase, partial [Leptolyngbya sp.]|nr:thiamine phosphate synthase [Candidatus Melainabacteria bacterium]